MSYYTDHGEILYQIRLNVSDNFTDNDVLNKLLESNNASLMCQYDAFVFFVRECENKNETDNSLYKWTKDTIKDEDKKAKYQKIHSVYVDKKQVCKEDIADKIIEEITNLNLSTIRIRNKVITVAQYF